MPTREIIQANIQDTDFPVSMQQVLFASTGGVKPTATPTATPTIAKPTVTQAVSETSETSETSEDAMGEMGEMGEVGEMGEWGPVWWMGRAYHKGVTRPYHGRTFQRDLMGDSGVSAVAERYL
jgi:hypothetical protein